MNEIELFTLNLVDSPSDEGDIVIFIGTFTSETYAVDGFIDFVKEWQKANDTNVSNWEKLETFLNKNPETLEDIQKEWQGWFHLEITRHRTNEIVAKAKDWASCTV
jgi:predicted HicB family RNase H-like nuclease